MNGLQNIHIWKYLSYCDLRLWQLFQMSADSAELKRTDNTNKGIADLTYTHLMPRILQMGQIIISSLI